MATNTYVRNLEYTEEQRLIDALTIESIQMFGQDIFYIPRSAVNEDPIFGEDVLQKYERTYALEAYLSSVDGFEGEGDILGRFGLEVRDSVNFSISTRRFEEEVLSNDRPLEGDLIYLPLSGGLFEIKFVEHENPFYQLGKLHTYQLSCELFRYSGEELDTGILEVDDVEKESGDTKLLTMFIDELKQEDSSIDNLLFGDNIVFEDIGGGNIIQESNTLATFTVDEVVYQGSTLATATAKGRVSAWDHDDRLLRIFVTEGAFKTTSENHLLSDETITDEDKIIDETDSDNIELQEIEAKVTGVTSGAVYNLGTIIDDPDALPYSDNAEYESQADDILDWSESSPFGEYGNIEEFEI